MNRITLSALLTVFTAALFLAIPATTHAQTAASIIGIRKYDNNLEAKYNAYEGWSGMGNMGELSKLRTAGNKLYVMPNAFANGGRTLYGRELNGPWKTLATSITDFEVSDNLIVIAQLDPMGGSLLRAKVGLDDQWTPIVSQTPINPNPGSLKVSGFRIAYVTSGGTLRVRDGLSGPWIDVATGTGSGWNWDISPQYVVLRRDNQTVLGRDTLSGGSGNWFTLANDFVNVTEVKVAGTRIGAFAFDPSRNTTLLRVKDGIHGNWYPQEHGVVGWDISPQYVVTRGKVGDSARLQVKQGLTDFWKDLGNTYGFQTPFVYGTKIAIWNGGTLNLWQNKDSARTWTDQVNSLYSIGPNQ